MKLIIKKIKQEFECSEAGEISGDWALYFRTKAEFQQFLQSLQMAWDNHFEVSLLKSFSYFIFFSYFTYFHVSFVIGKVIVYLKINVCY